MAKSKSIKNVKPATNGRPPVYKTPEEMQIAIDKYFEDCEGIPAVDKDGNNIYYKGELVYQKKPVPLTVPGLALALGFLSRQTLLNYQAKDGFMDTIMRAKLKIETYKNIRLYDKEGANGSKFDLTVNYGWRDTQSIELTGKISVEAYLKDCEDGEEF